MTSPAQWLDIAERAEKTSGQDLDLVTAAIGGPGAVWLIGCGDDGSDELRILDADGREVWSDYRTLAPDVSVDAVLALIAEMLPGWRVSVDQNEQWDATLVAPDWRDQGDDRCGAGRAGTAALALLAALARARASLAEQETTR